MNKKLLLLSSVLICLSSTSFADIMKWVDENGKTHYGDKVPEKYQTQAKPIDTKNSNFIENENLDANNEQFQKLRSEEEVKDKARKLEAERAAEIQRQKEEREKNTYKDRCSNMPNQAMEIRCNRGEF